MPIKGEKLPWGWGGGGMAQWCLNSHRCFTVVFSPHGLIFRKPAVFLALSEMRDIVAPETHLELFIILNF